MWTTLANIILDVVASIFFAIDIRSADTWPELLQWIGVQNVEQIVPLFSDWSTPSTLPVWIMLAYSSRFVFIEMINIWFLLVVAFIYFEILSEFIDEAPTHFDYAQHKAKENRAFEVDDSISEANNSGNHFRLDPTPKLASHLNNQRNERENGGVHRPYARSVSNYQQPDLDVDEAVERRLKNYQVVGLATLSPTSDSTKPDFQIRERHVNHAQRNSEYPQRATSSKPVIPKPVSVVPYPRDPVPDYDDHHHDGPHVRELRESLQRQSITTDRESVSVVAQKEDPSVARSSSFMNRPELRNQMPWSYIKAEEGNAVAPKRAFVNPITGQPVNLERSRSRSPAPIAEQ